MLSLKKSLLPFLCAMLSASVMGQIPVPDRENKANPYSGNPGVRLSESPEESDARQTFVENRVFSDLFGTGLPSFFREGDWRIRLNPKLGDFFDE